ncbi:microtubule-associated protein 10 [Aplochiton taeniatus]
MACYLNHFETLFSFEIFVEYIRTDNEEIWTSSDELALGVRLLDFPTLLIYQRGQDNLQHNHLDDCEKNNTLSEPRCDQFKYAFNKGKSCLFKINLNSLHAHLSNTPLYAMVLDVKEELPKLIGTSLISLAKIITHIRCDVEARGVSNPSFQGERGLVNIFNLMGEKIGRISLSYKLVSLGASLLPHIPENKVFTVGHDYGVELSKPTHQLQLILDDFCSGNETPDSETETPGPPIGQSGKTKVQTTSRQEEAQNL